MRTAPGRSGTIMNTPRGNIPVYGNIAEAMEAGHKFNVVVIYLPPSGVRDGVLEALRINPNLKDSDTYGKSTGPRCADNPFAGPDVWRRYIRCKLPGYRGCTQPGTYRWSVGRQRTGRISAARFHCYFLQFRQFHHYDRGLSGNGRVGHHGFDLFG